MKIVVFFLAWVSVGSAFSGEGKMVFERDRRPMGGSLVQIIVASQGDGSYELVKQTSRHEQVDTDTLGDDMDCEIDSLSSSGPESVVCVHDRRGTDGSRLEIAIARNGDGEYDVTETATYRGKKTVRQLATDLQYAD